MDAFFSELRREYLAEAPARLAELRKDLAALRAGEPDAFASLRSRFHRLAGSGGSYGFPSISKTSRELEQWLLDHPAITPEHAGRLETGIAWVAASFDSAAAELGLERPETTQPGFGWRALILGASGEEAIRLQRSLESAGYTVSSAPGTIDPSSLPISERPDLVVLFAPGLPDPLATGTLWSLPRPDRPRAAVVVGKGPFPPLDQSGAGIDCAFWGEDEDAQLVRFALDLGRIEAAPPSVLLVEKRPIEVATYTSMFEGAGMRLVLVADTPAAANILTTEVPDMVILSDGLIASDVIALARMIRRDDRLSLLPILALTELPGDHDRLELIRAGVDDAVSKMMPRNLFLQLVALRVERGRRVRELAPRDPLTGLRNHASIMAEFDFVIAYAKRNHETFSFVLIDVDHFRRINERHGHRVGDMTLSHVARTLQGAVRGSDLIGRCGSDEFGVLLRNCDPSGALLAAEKIRAALAGNPASLPDGTSIPIRFSAGMACYPTQGVTGPDLFLAAAQALAVAKGAGRDRVTAAGGNRND